MKHYIAILFFVFGTSFSMPALAAFPSGTPPAVTQNTIYAERTDDAQGKQKSGVFGMLSLFMSLVPLLSPLAIAFGIVGLGRHRKKRTLALIGLILGSLWLLLMIAITVMAYVYAK